MTFKLGDKVDIDELTGHISPAKIDAEADGEVTAILTRVDPPAVDVHVAFTEKGWDRLTKAKPVSSCSCGNPILRWVHNAPPKPCGEI